MSFNITPVANGYQEIHPYSAMNIDSVKINTSLIMMKECTITAIIPVHPAPHDHRNKTKTCWTKTILCSRTPKNFVFPSGGNPLPREGRQGGLRYIPPSFPFLFSFLSLFLVSLVSSFFFFSSGVSRAEAFLIGTLLPAASSSEYSSKSASL